MIANHRPWLNDYTYCLSRLFLAVAKANQCAFRKIRDTVGDKVKGVHWVLMSLVLINSKAGTFYGAPGEVCMRLVQSFLEFDFAANAFDARSCQIQPRTTPMFKSMKNAAVVLVDPVQQRVRI